jgi:purine nucleosidase
MSHIRYPEIDPGRRSDLLAGPTTAPARTIIDTDAANEIDDQFALTWALLSPDRLTIEAITIEPYSFRHHLSELKAAFHALETGRLDPRAVARTSRIDDPVAWAWRLLRQGRRPEDVEFVTPAEGMERSHDEARRILRLIGKSENLAVPGSTTYLASERRPVDSPAARRIVERALAERSRPLYVLAIGCLTNVASALLLDPAVVEHLVVVWTSAYPSWCPFSNAGSLNLVQDTIAARVVLESGVPFVYLPGFYVGAQLRLSAEEVAAHVAGHGAVGDYLAHLFRNNPICRQRAITDWQPPSWIIWDMIAVAWVMNPSWVPTRLVATPRLDPSLRWSRRRASPLMAEATDVDRDAIFLDFFERLRDHSEALMSGDEGERRG